MLIPLHFLAFKQPGFLKSMKIEIRLKSTLIDVIFTNLPTLLLVLEFLILELAITV